MARCPDRSDPPGFRPWSREPRSTHDHGGYHGLKNHETQALFVGEYVDGMAHTNGIESFWSMLKRGYHGIPTTK